MQWQTQAQHRTIAATTRIQEMILLDKPFVVLIVTFPLLRLAAWLGMVIRSRRQTSPESARSDYGVIVGATLTLLGLLIGFTFSMATTRYDQRKSLEEEEANAIGTEYAHLAFLPATDSVLLQPLLRQYTDLRIRFYSPRDKRDLEQIDAETARMQNQLWTIADIDSPRGGVIRVRPQNLYALAESLKAQS